MKYCFESILTSDLHVHPWRDCSHNGGRDRLDDALSAVLQTLEYARERGCMWTCLGDWKQESGRWHQAALHGLIKILREYRDVTETIGISGNGGHDGEGKYTTGETGLSPLNMYITHLATEPCILPGMPKLAIWPWQPSFDLMPKFLKKAKAENARILLAHGFLHGSKIGPDDIRLPDEGVPMEQYGLVGRQEKRVFDVGFFGDIHTRQRLGDSKQVKSAVVHYPGNPYQQNLGERDHAKGCLYVRVDEDYHVKTEFLPIKGPQYVKIDLANGPYTIETLSAEQFAGNFVQFLVAEMDVRKLAPKIAKLGADARDLKIIPIRQPTKTKPRAELHAGLPHQELLKRYVAAQPPPEGLDPAECLALGETLWQATRK